MMTLEQSLADLVFRGIVTEEVALSRSSKPEQLEGLIKRNTTDEAPLAAPSGLRVAEG